jgi:murein L,D-transpeptidase YcbB/YkuD
MENKLLDRIKLLSKYDTKKTLNENKTIIFEQDNVDQLVTNFYNARNSFVRVSNLISILKQLPNNANAFIRFFNGVKSKTDTSLGRHISNMLDDSDADKAIEISDIIKNRFGVTVKNNGVTNNRFNGMFNFPDATDKTGWGLKPAPNNVNKGDDPKSNLMAYNADGSEINNNKQTLSPPTPAQRVVPQKLDEVLQGKVFLKFGDKSPAVKELQQKLINLGYSDLGQTPTDYFGNKTKLSVIDFQTKNPPLTKDGAVGKNTLLKINEILKTKNKPGSGIQLKPSQVGIGGKISPTLK